MTIQEINAAARAEGLTYGQYVDRHKDDPEPESEPKAPEEIRTCQWCGAPLPIDAPGRKRFCSKACRGAAQYAAKSSGKRTAGSVPSKGPASGAGPSLTCPPTRGTGSTAPTGAGS